METSNKKPNTNSAKALNGNETKSIKTAIHNSGNQTPAKPKGGRTTISPPAKLIHPGSPGVQVLASNIDTIKLSINVNWQDNHFFSILKEAKMLAQAESREYPIDFGIKELNQNNYLFNIKEFGSQGYEWILFNQEYSLLIGNWDKPKSRPSVLLTIRSETLWRRGPYEAICFILMFLKNQNGIIRQPKISRLDLCVDTLFPAKLWKMALLRYKVTRASSTKTFLTHNRLSGISIGKDQISARMYDKPLEIQQQSNKTWLFDVWGVDFVPEDFRIIRTEFQLRREAIKELGIHTLDILFDEIMHIWAYCTKKWLQFQDNPGKQSQQRKILPWWQEIQNGFNGMTSGHPAIRVKASNAEKDALCQQILGLLSSYAALVTQTTDYFDYIPLELGTVMTSFYDAVIDNQLSDLEFRDRVENKKAKYQRIDAKMKEALGLRESIDSK